MVQTNRRTPLPVSTRLDVGDEGVEIVAPEPLARVQAPVSPVPGALPASTTVPALQLEMSAPALGWVRIGNTVTATVFVAKALSPHRAEN